MMERDEALKAWRKINTAFLDALFEYERNASAQDMTAMFSYGKSACVEKATATAAKDLPRKPSGITLSDELMRDLVAHRFVDRSWTAQKFVLEGCGAQVTASLEDNPRHFEITYDPHQHT